MTLKEYQDILFDILCSIDDICKRNNITYVLHGGSMLGAVRHHDFIPWDDDVDIMVWHKDYARLCTKLKEELPQHLKVVEPIDLAPHFFDFVTRVQDIRHRMHEAGEEDSFYENKQNYACVDIFQFAYTTDTVWKAKCLALLHKVLYGLGMGHRYQIKDERYTFLQKLQTGALSFIGSKISMERIIKWKEGLIDWQNKKPGKYCMSVNGLVQNMNRRGESKWYEDVTYMQFRDRRFPVPVGYDEHLTLQYGNYMVPVQDADVYIQHFTEEVSGHEE